MRADPGFAERYTLEERLGSGAMGSVWRGQQRALGRPVAIKFMSPQLAGTPEFRDRFAAEARAVARLIHTHVTAVFDSGVAGGVPFLVTELVEGKPLSALLSTPGQLDANQRMVIAGHIFAALEAIHALHIVHRDIKPTNVMVTLFPQLTAKVLDFGIAKKLDEELGLTQVGVLLGSPAYMSPEQASGQKLTPASDLYALTTVIYEMVLGAPPFVGKNALETIQMRLTHEAIVPGDLVPALADLLTRGLSRDPAARLANSNDYRTALARASDAVQAAGAFTPSGHTFHGRFVPQSSVARTAAGTALSQLEQAPEPAGRSGPVGPTRQPWIAVALLAGLLALASAAKKPAAPPVAAATPTAPVAPPSEPPPKPAPEPTVEMVRPFRGLPQRPIDRLRQRFTPRPFGQRR